MASDKNIPWNTEVHPSPVLFLAKNPFFHYVLLLTSLDIDFKT